MKTSRLYNILMLLCLLLAPCLAQAQDKVKTQKDLGGQLNALGRPGENEQVFVAGGHALALHKGKHLFAQGWPAGGLAVLQHRSARFGHQPGGDLGHVLCGEGGGRGVAAGKRDHARSCEQGKNLADRAARNAIHTLSKLHGSFLLGGLCCRTAN